MLKYHILRKDVRYFDRELHWYK